MDLMDMIRASGVALGFAFVWLVAQAVLEREVFDRLDRRRARRSITR